MKSTVRKAIIIGATSGIGRELARNLDKGGYELAICGRREELLTTLDEELSLPTIKQKMDISDQETSMEQLNELFDKMEEVDLVVLNSGIAFLEKDLLWEKDAAVIDVNVSGFTALAGASFRYFCKQKKGQFVGVSSLASRRGGPATSYNASKAYMSSYLEGMRFHISKRKLPITVTEVRPGFVSTGMAQGNLFWLIKPERAAKDIYKAIIARKKVAYITPRWRLIAWVLAILPDSIYHKM